MTQSVASNDLAANAIPDVIRGFGFEVNSTVESGGLMKKDGVTVAFNAESTHEEITGIELHMEYRFPTRLSERGLQDWAASVHPRLLAQTSLNGSVYTDMVLPIQRGESRDEFKAQLSRSFDVFSMFEANFLHPLHGQEVLDGASINPPKPSNKLLVDYLSYTDFRYLAKIWGWNYDGTYAAVVPMATWEMPVWIDRREWRITGYVPPRDQTKPPTTGFGISARLTFGSPEVIPGVVARWRKHHPNDVLQYSSNSNDLLIRRDVEFGNGLTISQVKSRLLDFVHRVEKLGSVGTSVYG